MIILPLREIGKIVFIYLILKVIYTLLLYSLWSSHICSKIMCTVCILCN